MPTRLITAQEIREATPMGGNVDSDKFINFIDDVQVFKLEPILGTKLYDKIVADFVADTLAGLYLQMFNDYIKPVLWHGVFAEYVKLGSFIVGNGGTYRHVAQDAELASAEDLGYLAKSAQSKADSYGDRLIRFLCDQKNNIPEYTYAQDNNYDIEPKNALQTISGWHLTGSKRDDADWRIAPSGGGASGDFIELED